MKPTLTWRGADPLAPRKTGGEPSPQAPEPSAGSTEPDESPASPPKRERRKKRLYGFGSVYRRESGIVWIAFRRGGKRHADSSLSTNERDARNLLNRCLEAWRAGTFTSIAAVRDGTPEVVPDSVKEIAERWLEHAVRITRDEKGYRLAQARVTLYLVPFLGRSVAAKLTADDLMDYRGWLARQNGRWRQKDGTVKEGRPLTAQTQRHILSDCRALVLWAEQRGLMQRGLVPKRRFLPRAPEKPLRSLTLEQQTAVRSVDEPYGFAVRLMIDSGVRWSELCRLTRDDLVGSELVIHGPTKSGKMRKVPIPPALVTEIKGHVGKLVAYEGKDVSWFNHAVRNRSGVEAFSAHSCRHSYGFNYMARGGNLLALQQQMGHSTVTLTAHYAKPNEEFIRADAAKVHLQG